MPARTLDVPASVDRVSGEEIQRYQPEVNLSESLLQVPGLVVSNRQNYAQDLQITSRGFGARATFGVRGIRLIQDGIPATMPDGSGQAGSFDLGGAERIEVLRGPFSSQYGNASGGVIQVFTADGPARPQVGAGFWAGSYGSSRLSFDAGGQEGRVNYVGDLSRFTTDGYRDHSAATRDLANGRIRIRLDNGSRITLVGNEINQVDTQDPGGLTVAELASNRRGVDPSVTQFNTRKSIAQSQLGGTWEDRLSNGDRLAATLYGGNRDINQYLGLSGAAITSSGGVVSLSSAYSGASLRWQRGVELAGRPLTLSAGAELDSMQQRRRGYTNLNGASGALRRDEDDAANSTGAYVQAEWRFAERWSALAGLRRSDVAIAFADHFIVPGNGDDSGTLHFHATTPAASLMYRAAEDVNLYASYGRGFETPTLVELAYSTAGAGPNFGLRPATSNQVEVGAKAALPGGSRLNVALFDIGTANEIVVASSTGGRTVYKNASHTRRRGAEVSWQVPLPHSLEFYFGYTYLDARFTDGFTSTGPVSVGNFLPAVPKNVLYARLSWRYPAAGFGAVFELRKSSQLFVDDLNSASAPGYTIANLRGGFDQSLGGWKVTEFVRVENLLDRQYIGSVIVADTNNRFFEPAPGRNAIAG
ncbi:MAG TPA: TonB-dependent receptor, partial [Burkholderiales bacterium]|nr:TonB-dependent receptor [Burkholderiales bacterium]